TLADSAEALRTALTDAVALRTSRYEHVGADLSGALDSTSLCLLAAESGTRLTTATIRWSAPGNEDHQYAAVASASLPGSDDRTFASSELPPQFAGLGVHHEPGDEPSLNLRSRVFHDHIASDIAAAGARCRLNGPGGDDVVQPPTGGSVSLLRQDPMAGWRHLSAIRAQHRWSARATLATMVDRSSYHSWVRASAASLTNQQSRALPRRWGNPVALPSWATTQAQSAVASLLAEAPSESLTPNSTSPVHHRWLHQIQQSGQLVGEAEHDAAQAGIRYHAPFLDQEVITACLLAPPHQAHQPQVYKPLLTAAMG